MLPDTVFGLPLHPLVVHAVVVLLPLSALGAIALALVPGWRGTYGWLVLVGTIVSAIAAPIATNSGQAFKEELNLGGEVAEKVSTHQDYGELVVWAALALLFVNAVLLSLHRAGRTGALSVAFAGLTVIAALTSLVLVVLTGHSGSEAVWNPGG